MSDGDLKAGRGERAYEIVCQSDADRARWLKARRSGIGASDMPAVMGASGWNAAIAIYGEKTGLVEPDEEQDEAMFWGSRLERTIADVYAERSGRAMLWSGFLVRSVRYPWALATLDFLTGDDSASWPGDAKNVSAYKANEWVDGPPPIYQIQLQQQMLVTGHERATAACLIGGQRHVWCDVVRDEALIARIVEAGEAFWECVQTRTIPAVDGSASASRTLARLYPSADADKIVPIGVDFEASFDELRRLKRTITIDEKRRAEIENAFKVALGDAVRGTLPSGASVSWSNTAGGIDYKAAALALGATPAVLERFRRANTRTFRQHDPKEEG